MWIKSLHELSAVGSLTQAKTDAANSYFVCYLVSIVIKTADLELIRKVLSPFRTWDCYVCRGDCPAKLPSRVLIGCLHSCNYQVITMWRHHAEPLLLCSESCDKLYSWFVPSALVNQRLSETCKRRLCPFKTFEAESIRARAMGSNFMF